MSRDRDHILEQALKHELRAQPALRSSNEGGCLDAETLGAWSDGGLDPAAMAAAEAHLADCARCQTMAATLARSTPVIEAGPEASGVSLWKWWLAPLAAGVAATTLWMVVPEQQQISTAPSQAKRADVAQNPAAAEAVPPAPARDAASGQFAEADKLAAAAGENRQRARANEQKKEEQPARRVQERSAMADAAAPAAIPAAPPSAAAPAPGALAESVTALQKSTALAAAPIEISTLDPSVGWRIAGDRIERSDNAGKTWTVKRQNSGDGLVAGSAPSTSVAWFVGRAGRVLLTTDSGATFADISLAEPLDLASVAAIDSRNASVFSVVGRRFRTDDGGRTWRPF